MSAYIVGDITDYSTMCCFLQHLQTYKETHLCIYRSTVPVSASGIYQVHAWCVRSYLSIFFSHGETCHQNAKKTLIELNKYYDWFNFKQCLRLSVGESMCINDVTFVRLLQVLFMVDYENAFITMCVCAGLTAGVNWQ